MATGNKAYIRISCITNLAFVFFILYSGIHFHLFLFDAIWLISTWRLLQNNVFSWRVVLILNFGNKIFTFHVVEVGAIIEPTRVFFPRLIVVFPVGHSTTAGEAKRFISGLRVVESSICKIVWCLLHALRPGSEGMAASHFGIIESICRSRFFE